MKFVTEQLTPSDAPAVRRLSTGQTEFDERYLESMLEDSLEAYVRTVPLNVIEDVHGTMEARKQML